MRRLGDILTRRGSSNAAQLEQAATLQKTYPDTPIGELLRNYAGVGTKDIAAALAEQRDTPPIWLDRTPPDDALFHLSDIPHYIAFDAVPWRMHGNHLIMVSAAPCPALKRWAQERYGVPVIMMVTSPRDIAAYLHKRGGNYFTREARHKLHRQHRHMSALRTLTKRQQWEFGGLVSAILVMAIWLPESSSYIALWASNLFYISTILFKFLLLARWWRTDRFFPTKLSDQQLPRYSILVPMYKEPETVIRNIIHHLHALQYPHHKKEVFLLCESDDIATIDAIKAAHPPEYMRIIAVPESQPRTKPKACNYVLPLLKGEYVVIYDAEDRPDPYQLQRAAEYFACKPETACLQSPLNYYNRNENILTRLFAIEYSALFRMQLPALRSLGAPIPLGGTSNHIRRNVLLRIGAWDPFNVTEDADLGMRLAYYGYQTDMLDSITMEEAPIHLGAWLKQRSRWIKGYIQTWLVYMRDPKALKAHIGYDAYIGFQFFVGAPALTFILAPLFWLGCLMGVIGALYIPIPPLLVGLCIASLVLGVVSHWLFARTVQRIEAWDGMWLAMLLYPFYWLLHSVASIMAVRDLIIRPHHWVKTQHGVTRHR
jgi:cellulose synthase/poly-beta-1,6-N-acetylglucosamine synthase-like glycosyltransferase